MAEWFAVTVKLSLVRFFARSAKAESLRTRAEIEIGRDGSESEAGQAFVATLDLVKRLRIANRRPRCATTAPLTKVATLHLQALGRNCSNVGAVLHILGGAIFKNVGKLRATDFAIKIFDQKIQKKNHMVRSPWLALLYHIMYLYHVT